MFFIAWHRQGNAHKTMKTLLKASLIATAIASIPSSAFALGAGPINVFSGLGQPLRAEVPLSATPQELQSLSARIAPPDAFRQANIPYSSALSLLRVSVDNSGSKPVLRISSDRPVNEPFLDLLLEFSWDAGRLVREYTFLLDPVALAPVQPAQPASAPTQAPSRVAPAAAASPAAASGSYRVQRGDTLRRIAEESRPADVTLDQMLIALARENPAAFDDGNINRMRAGAILNMPSAEQVRAIDRTEARREVVAQAADFEAYRRRLAGAAAATPAAPDTADQASEGRITPRVEETARPDASTDRVQVSRAADDAAAESGDAARTDRLRALEEDLVARDRALEEANQRLVELERSIRDLQKLIELKSEQLAQLQQQAGTGTPPAAAPGAEAPAAAADTPAAETPAPAAEASQPAQAPAPAAEAQVSPAAPTPAPAPEPSVEPKAEPAPAPAPKPAPPAARKPAPQPAPQPQPSFLDELLGDPMTLAAGGGVLALLLGYAGFKLRQRRKQSEGAGLSSALMSEAPTGPNSVFGVTGGQSVDTSSSSVLQTDFSQSGLSSIDTDEGVDPVAEADVYMAYGRDAQAEEILVDALKADPSRLAIYLKLLELYAARKSLKQFETIAADLYARTSGEGSEWAKAAALGREIDPENPLYAADRGGEAGDIEESVGDKAGQPSPATAAAAGAAGVAALAGGLGAGEEPEQAEQAASVDDAGQDLTQSLGALDFDLPDIEPAEQPAAEEPHVEPEVPEAGEEGESQLKDTWAMPGGQLAFTGTETGGESEALEAPVPEVDSNVLDFDLDFEEPAAAAPEAGSAEPDLEEGAAQTDASNLTATVVASSAQSEGEAADEAFIDLDAPQETGAPNEAEPVDLAATVIAGSDTYGAETQIEGVNAFSEQGGDVVDLEESSFDTNLLDFDFELDSPTAASGGEPPALDLSSIDLELETPQEAQPDVGGERTDVAAEDARMPAGEAAGGQEVDTKLELARAYEEMGDKEGARELLDEVLREGSDSQQAAARELLARLD